MATTKSNPSLTLSAAQAAAAACEAKAKEIGVPMNIAVVDNATHLLSFSRCVLIVPQNGLATYL